MSEDKQAEAARCAAALHLHLLAAWPHVDDFPKAVQTASVLFGLYMAERVRLIGVRIKAQTNPDYKARLMPQSAAVETYAQALRLYLLQTCGEASTSLAEVDAIIDLFEAHYWAERGLPC